MCFDNYAAMPFGLTPARFDMLRVVRLHAPHGAAQWKIRALLGVSGATVSRMLKSLEQLGFVERRRSERDARDVIVKLSALGKICVSLAVDALIDRGVADTFAKRGVDFDFELAAAKLGKLQTDLSSMRSVYGDAAIDIDPWQLPRPGLVTTVVNGRICYGKPFAI